MNKNCPMRAPLLILLMCRLLTATASAQHEEHVDRKGTPGEESKPSVLTGKLVDSTWFVQQADAHSEQVRVSLASANLANGVPAALIPQDAKDEKDVWFLLTNPTVLAPYAGKSIKVEGRLLNEIRAIVPTAVYVGDADVWRQVQLAAPPEKPTKTESGHVEHPAEREKPTAPPDQRGKTEPGHAEHPVEHEKPTDALREKGHENGHQAGDGESRAYIKPGGGDHQHDGEHEHWLVLALPPEHPVLVHFTVGLFPAAVLADWLGRLLRRRSLNVAAWWMLLFAAVVTPLTALAGWLWFRELGDMGHAQMAVHKWLGSSLAVALPVFAMWRGRIHVRGRDPSRTYLITATVALLALALQGHLGATMSFLPHENAGQSTEAVRARARAHCPLIADGQNAADQATKSVGSCCKKRA